MIFECLGHACLIARAGKTSVLFDPLLFDTHHEALYEIWPRRKLSLDALPPISAVVITHRHFDHFDIASIGVLDRSTPILVPADEVIAAALHELGFKTVLTVESLCPVEIDGLELVPTPSSSALPENGYILSDGTNCVWNVVDTVPSADQIAEVKQRFPTIDLAVVPWQPLLDTEIPQTDVPTFPEVAYARLLDNALQIDAGALALGACGFRHASRFAWMNHVVFPVSAERFMADALRANPRWAGKLLRPVPGDTLEVGDPVRLRRQALDYCALHEEQPEDDVEWLPWFGRFSRRMSTLADRLPLHRERFRRFFETTLAEFVQSHPQEFYWHYRCGVVANMTVVCRDASASWSIDFSSSVLRVSAGREPLALAQSVITGDALRALLENRVSWSFVALSADYWETGWKRQPGPGAGASATIALSEPLRSFFGGDDHLAATLLGALRRLPDTGGRSETQMEMSNG